MFGVILTSTSSLFSEVFAVIGKKEVQRKGVGIYTLGFLMIFWGAILFLGIIIWKASFDFYIASLPTFIPRIFIEVILISVSLKTLIVVDRSTFSFLGDTIREQFFYEQNIVRKLIVFILLLTGLIFLVL